MTALTLAQTRVLSWHTLRCRFCGRPVGQRCRTASGALTVPHTDRMDDIAIWLSRQPEVDTLTAQLALAGDQADDLRDEITDLTRAAEYATNRATKADADLTAYKAAHPDTTPVVVADPPVVVPADAIWLHPSGNDNNPGTQAKPRLTPLPNRANFGEGLLAGFRWKPTAGTKTSLTGLPGKTLVLSGGDTLPRCIEASGQVTLKALTIDGYAPTGPGSSFTSAAVYLGGTAAGSSFEAVKMTNSKMGHLSLAVPDVTLRGCDLTDAAHYGLLAASSDRLLLEDVVLARLNRGGYDPETQAASGAKVTWSDSVTFRRVTASDIPGGYGLWWDASCTRTKVLACDVDGSAAGGRAQMVHCIQLEKSDGGLYDGVQSYAYVIGGSTKGAKAAGVKILSSGYVKIWGGQHHGNGWADIIVQQDASMRGPGGDTRNRDPKTSPWTAVGVELGNVNLDKLWVYDDGRKVLKPEQMVTRIQGLTMAAPTLRWGPSTNLTLTQVAQLLGSKYRAGVQPIPADVAAAIARP